MTARPSRLRRQLSGGEGWQRYALRRQRGRPSPLVDAATMRAHVDRLTGWGLSWASIAEAAGVSRSFLVDQMRCRNGRRVFAEHAAAVLAVGHLPHPAQTVVLAVGCRRRVEALAADGWPLSWQAQRLGILSRRHLLKLVTGATITGRRQRQLCALYAELENVPGPSQRSRTWAAKAGRPGPWAWDPDTIDDPDATPADYARTKTVEATLDDVDWLNAGGLSDGDAAARLGVSLRTVERARRSARAAEAYRRLRGPVLPADDIRARVAAGEHPRAVAAFYGCTAAHVRNIVARRYRSAPEIEPEKWSA